MSRLFPEKVVIKVGPTEILVGEKRVACDPAYGADPWSGALAALAAHKPEAPCRVTVVLANPLVRQWDLAVPLLDALLDANRPHLPRFFADG